MRTTFSRYYLLLLLGLVALVLSSCASVLAADPPSQVTPDTTNPSTLKVAITIDDEQNATDGKVGFTMQFATDEISNANFIEFTHGESVSCNDTPLTFNSPNYTARVIRPVSNSYFTCYYKWNGKSYLFVHLKVRSELRAFLPVNADLQNPNFDIHYNTDATLPPCSMNVALSDNSTTINTSFKESQSGVFRTSITTLSGVGALVLTRTCGPSSSGRGKPTPSDTGTTFDTVTITYKSTYGLYEFWEPPA